jgi:proline racemase
MHRLGPIEVADYHIAGQPFRIVTAGVPPIEGEDALARRGWAQQHLDELRRLLVNEPRGYAGTHGCFVTVPGTKGASVDAICFDQSGFGVGAGHDAIAIATWAIETGVVPVDDGHGLVSIDAPAGRVETRVEVRDGKVHSVTYRTGTAYVAARYMPLQLSDDVVSLDIVFAGSYLAMIDAVELGVAVTTENFPRFARWGREIGAILQGSAAVVHPVDHRLSGLSGTVFYEHLDRTDGGSRQRSVTVSVDGRVGRSPSGTGTSARLAVLDSLAGLPRGEWLIDESAIGTTLAGCVVGDGEVGGIHGVITQIEGRAHGIGDARIWVDDLDPLGLGFQLT